MRTHVKNCLRSSTKAKECVEILLQQARSFFKGKFHFCSSQEQMSNWGTEQQLNLYIETKVTVSNSETKAKWTHPTNSTITAVMQIKA